MAGEINFGLADPSSAFKGARQTNDLLKAFAQARAGKMLASGDVVGAQGALNTSGDLAGARDVQTQHWAEDDRVKKLALEKQKESATFTADASSALYNHMREHATDPDGGVGAVLQGFDQIAPVLAARGAAPEDVANYRAQLAKDPTNFLTLMHNEATSHLKNISLSEGAQLVDPTGKVLAANPKTFAPAKPAAPSVRVVVDGNGEPHVMLIDPSKVDAAPAAGATPLTPIAPITTPESFDALAGAVKAQESGGAPGVEGPASAYGKAQGSMQTLPKTAEAMAKKLGIAWHPELLTAKTPEGAAYQEKLGRAYLQEGVDKYGGDPRQAAMYYYGGPDEKLWGPKTHAYADHVMARLTPTQVASAGASDVSGSAAVRELWHGVPKPPAAAKKGEALKLSNNEEKTLYDMRKQYNELQTVVGAVDEFVDLNKKHPTGGMMAGPGVGAVVSAFNPDLSRMTSITSKLTPAMRNGLPGAASDKDVAMFRDSTVSIAKPYEANLANARATKAMTSRIGDHIAFLDSYANKHGTLRGGEEIWKNYVDAHPMFGGHDKAGGLILNKPTPWRQAIPQDEGTAPASAAPTRTRTYDPATGTFH